MATRRIDRLGHLVDCRVAVSDRDELPAVRRSRDKVRPDMDPVEFTIPVPPTDNRYYGKPKGKLHKYVTKAGKLHRHEVAVIVNNAGLRGTFGSARLSMKVVLHLSHGGDIQNRLKGLCDSLEHSEIFNNDKQIDDLRIIRGHPVEGGRCVVTLWRRD